MPKLLCLLLGLVMWFSPHPTEIPDPAWHLFSLFVPTIVAIIAKVMPVGSICVVTLSICLLTQTLSIQQAFSGFANPVIWLIVLAFFIARGFIKTGLGNRIAYLFVYLLGRRSLSLAYGLIAGDLILSPAIPSNTARAGGIFFPIVKSLSEVFGSSPENGTHQKVGSFLILSSFHGNIVTSAMFLTAMAANPLVAHFAGLSGVSITWTRWAVAAIVPGLLSLAVTPLLIYFFAAPEMKETPNAKSFASTELGKMGPLSRSEKSLIGVFVFLLIGWIFPNVLGGASATVVALTGLALLLVLGVLDWEDVKNEAGAWDTLVWFAVLVTFATFLDTLGFSAYLGSQMGSLAQGVSWQVGSLVLIVAYFLSHYFFASSTAHVSALYATFLVLGLELGAPALPLALLLGFTSNLYGGLTHYSVGHAPIFFGSGYVDIKEWWKIGFIVCSCNLLIWTVVGSMWMKFLAYF